MTVQIAPSLLAADPMRLGEAVAVAEEAGADLLHCDIMDGHFVPNLSMGPATVAAARRMTALPIECHLMVQDPDPFLGAFRDAGADLITVHWEACRHLERTISAIHDLGCLAGVAINPATPVAFLDPIWDELDWVLVMTVNPGFGGQQFWAPALHKIEQARSRRGVLDRPRLAVDGGIDEETARRVVAAGADVLVAGTAVFGSKDPRGAIARLRAAVTPAAPES
jgi:ribulose-phosphate 3-epimerase